MRERTGPLLRRLNPATEEPLAPLRCDAVAGLAARYAAAKGAQRAWHRWPLEERREIVEIFGKLLMRDAEKLARVTSAETGKPWRQAQDEIHNSIPRIRFFLDRVAEVLAPCVMQSGKNLEEQITKEPLGVVANISAWNFPYFIGVNVLVPALLTGNAVLYKPSEIAAHTGLELERLLLESGLPEGLFQAVIGQGDVGAALVGLPVDGVYFTGSHATGKRIAESVAGRMIRTQFELGGKDACYVMDDVDIVKAVTATLDGAFFNAGQSCCAVERLYVHEGVYDPFLEQFATRARSIRPGNPADEGTYLGPLARKEQLAVLEAQVEDAVSKGGRLLCGGKRMEGKGWYLEPTVIADARESMIIMQEESFGPVIGICKVGSDEEALNLMNGTDYGLTASVFGADERRVARLLERVEAGTVYQNLCDRVSPYVPWTGRKRSGLGSTLSLIGIEAFAQPKSWQVKRVL